MAEGGYTTCKREIKVSLPFAQPQGSICARRWSGLKEAHCPTCHEHFSTVTNFDLHRQGGKCIDPARVTDGGRKLLRPVERASGTVWLGADEKDIAAILHGRKDVTA